MLKHLIVHVFTNMCKNNQIFVRFQNEGNIQIQLAQASVSKRGPYSDDIGSQSDVTISLSLSVPKL
jgi:hypothetical protein